MSLKRVHSSRDLNLPKLIEDNRVIENTNSNNTLQYCNQHWIGSPNRHYRTTKNPEISVAKIAFVPYTNPEIRKVSEHGNIGKPCPLVKESMQTQPSIGQTKASIYSQPKFQQSYSAMQPHPTTNQQEIPEAKSQIRRYNSFNEILGLKKSLGSLNPRMIDS